MSSVIEEFVFEGHYGTAHVYRSVLKSVHEYACRNFLMEDMTPTFLKGYENYLIYYKGRQWNTSSTYMRCLQTVYNRAVDLELTPYFPRQFKGVFTGTKRNHQRSLSVENVREVLIEKDESVEREDKPVQRHLTEKARACLELMLRFQGMPFVDLAFLRKNDLKNGYLVLRRHKTQTPLYIRISKEAMNLLRKYGNNDLNSPYLLDILDGHLTGYEAYQNYQSKLRQVNQGLRRLAVDHHLPVSLSTYCARHTWATQAKYCGVPTEVISEGLGHASVTTTEAYLKSFENGVLDYANEVVMKYIFKNKRAKKMFA